MGLMRRVESRLEKSMGAAPQNTPPNAPKSGRSKKEPPFVQPGELASALVEEMEERKKSASGRALVCNSYTVYLRPRDYDHLAEDIEEVEDKLYGKLEKHIGKKRYSMAGELSIVLVQDPELPPGKFGVRAEFADSPQPVDQAVPAAPAAEPYLPEAVDPVGATFMPVLDPSVEAEALAAPAIETPAARAEAKDVIVVRSGSRVRDFAQNRVVIGRGRDTDFRLDDPNVSRRHASLYVDHGILMVQDLESTNGTMVNGYPVTKTVLRPSDVLVIGDCRITAEARLSDEA